MLMPAAPVRLLLVEDHAPLRTLFEVFLRQQGYAVQVVASLHEAQSLLDTQVFALLVVELGPSTSAEPFTALEVMRDQIYPTPVFLLSRWEHSLEEATRRGFSGLLEHPFSLETLVTTLETCLPAPLTPEHARQAQVVQAYFAWLSACQWDRLIALCTEDVTGVLPDPFPCSDTLHGTVALRAALEAAAAQGPAAAFDVMGVFAQPTGLMVRYQAQWMAPDGHPSTRLGAVTFVFVGERITHLEVRPALEGT